LIGSLTIVRINAGDGNDHVRLMLRRAGDMPADTVLVEASFESFCRALLGEGEVTIEVFTRAEAQTKRR
jgi:hypothetical protein